MNEGSKDTCNDIFNKKLDMTSKEICAYSL